MSEYKMAVHERKPAWNRDFLLKIASTREHNHQGFHYSNIGYLLLSMLVEKECSAQYFGAISELVLRPLRINGFHEWKSPHPQIPDYDPNWVYSGTVLSSPQAIAPSLLTLAKYRDESIGLNAGITRLSYPNTGFEEPGYGYGFMTDGGGADSLPRYVGHGGGGPGFSLMAIVSTSDWKAELIYSSTEFDQSKAITSLINSLNDVIST
jgi:CubicO group peptidase (beta-lactamase class C family)